MYCPRSHQAPAPGPQLILAPPDKVSRTSRSCSGADAEQHGGRDFHQRVVGGLLLLAACVPIVQIVDLVSYLWGRGGGVGTDHRSRKRGGRRHTSQLEGVFKQQFTCVDSKGASLYSILTMSLTSCIPFSLIYQLR